MTWARCSRRLQHPYTRELLAAVAPVGGSSGLHEPVVPRCHRRLLRSRRGQCGVAHSCYARTRVERRARSTSRFARLPFGKQQTLRAVDGVSLELAAGEAVGVVGESGSGKSTLARAALQLLRSSRARVVWLGRQVDALAQRRCRPLRRDVQLVFQDPLASLDPRMTVREIVAEPFGCTARISIALARDAAVVVTGPCAARSLSWRTAIRTSSAAANASESGIARAMVPAAVVGLRRAGERARRHGPGADRQPAGRPQARGRPVHPVHQPQSGRRAAAV